MIDALLERRCIKNCPSVFKRCRRNTGGNHEENIERESFGSFKHIVQRIQTTHITDFVWVCDDGGRSMGNHQVGKRSRVDKGGFDMYMGVDQTRNQIVFIRIDSFSATVGSYTGNITIDDSDIGFLDCAAEYIHHM